MKSGARLDDSEVLQIRKNRPRSSIVLTPGECATQPSSSCGASSSSPATQMDSSVLAPTDALLLYWTLVSDNAVPPGHEKEFAALEPAIQRASVADIRRSTSMCNVSSAVWLHQREERLNSTFRLKKLSEDQFLLAAQTRPTRFRAKWQKLYCDGPTARRVPRKHSEANGWRSWHPC